MATPCCTQVISPLRTSTTSISSIHASLKNFIKQGMRSYPHNNLFVFSKMWLPWQRLVVPKLYHLYAHLHINIIHPVQVWTHEISLKSKWVNLSAQEFFNVFSNNVVTMATHCRTQVISPLCTSTHQYHPSMQVWRNFIKQWMRSYPHKNFSINLVKCGYHGNALAYPSYITFTHISTHQYHPSMQVWRNFIKQRMRSYPHKNWLTDGRTPYHNTTLRAYKKQKGQEF